MIGRRHLAKSARRMTVASSCPSVVSTISCDKASLTSAKIGSQSREPTFSPPRARQISLPHQRALWRIRGCRRFGAEYSAGAGEVLQVRVTAVRQSYIRQHRFSLMGFNPRGWHSCCDAGGHEHNNRRQRLAVQLPLDRAGVCPSHGRMELRHLCARSQHRAARERTRVRALPAMGRAGRRGGTARQACVESPVERRVTIVLTPDLANVKYAVAH